MSYDIPDEIKYKEKIAFGLTLKQFCYLCAFGLLAVFSYNLPLQGEAKLVLPFFFLVAGLGFVFLNLEEKAFDAYHFLTGVRRARPADPAVQKFVGIDLVKSNIVYLRDGGLRAILKVEPVNFSLLEESQRKALILNYREFLNHLTTPVQVLVRTSKPDLQEYFNEAQEKLGDASSDLKSLFRDFMIFEQKFLDEHNVRERNFYLVVAQEPLKRLGRAPDVEEAAKLLEEKAKIAQEKLTACGLKSTRLKNAELVDFLSEYSSQEADSSEEEAGEETGSKQKQFGKSETKSGRKK